MISARTEATVFRGAFSSYIHPIFNIDFFFFKVCKASEPVVSKHVFPELRGPRIGYNDLKSLHHLLHTVLPFSFMLAHRHPMIDAMSLSLQPLEP
jgi:hypothetical protein